MKTFTTLIAGAVAAAALATTAYAAVIFDGISGTGFVGKGDVQLAFGWNNAQLQSNAPGVTFSYQSQKTYDVTCEWDTGTRNVVHHLITIPRKQNINSAVAYDARTRNQITGFTLTGFGDTTVTGPDVPAVGESCPGNQPGEVTAVIEVGGAAGQLFVNYGGTSVLLQ